MSQQGRFLRQAFAAACVFPLAAAAAHAQAIPAPTPFLLDTLVASAERTPVALGQTVAPTTVLPAALFVGRAVTMADVLAQVPGIALSGFDAYGRTGAPVVRGFFGGGEAEYLVVLVNGRPVSRLLNGTVPWHTIPLAAVERIELTRGGASPQFGDAAIGGVLNIVTRDAGAGRLTVRPGSGALAGISVPGPVSFTVEGEADSGDRPHAATRRLTGTVRTEAPARVAGRVSAALDVAYGDFEIPGPVLRAPGERVTTDFDSLYRFDAAIERSARLALGFGARRPVRLTAELSDVDFTRTFPLSTEYVATQRRKTDVARATLSGDTRLGRWLSVGAELSHAAYGSEYHRVAAGTRADYRTATPAGGLLSSGGGTRSAGALFGQVSLSPGRGLRLVLGVRGDLLRDAFEDTAAETRGAVSPQLGVSHQFVASARARGHWYLSLSTSFKAPTPDQLFDQRVIDVPGMGGVSFSNAGLEPQRLRGIEAGITQQLQLRDDLLLLLDASWFRSRMRNEIDFDLAQFRYANIGRSRHGGWEIGARLSRTADATTAFASYTVQWAEAQSGEYRGNRLKGIPGTTLAAGVRLPLPLRPEVRYTRSARLYLDDGNTASLGFDRFDAGLGRTFGAWTVALDVTNLGDVRAPVGGYVDPAGSGLEYVLPGARRAVSVTVRRQLAGQP